MDLFLVAEWVVKSVLVLLILLAGFAWGTWVERRTLARMQTRIGPNRAGPMGLLQPVADGIKLIFKEELIPDQADKVVFILAPVITVIPALIVLAVVPVGPDIHLLGRTIKLGLAGDVNVGVLYIMSVTSIAVYGVTLAGWSSHNKYALMGGLRSAAQMVSYELALALAFVAPSILAGSMSLKTIIESQSGLGWYALLNPIGFAIFLTASIAEIHRSPFDMPEAEQELTAGFHSEYSGLKFALFIMTEYIKMVAISAITAALFLGGYQGPFASKYPILGPFYFGIKTFLLYFLIIWMRATLPRFRYDRLMAFGWKILLPVALFNVVITAIVKVLDGG